MKHLGNIPPVCGVHRVMKFAQMAQIIAAPFASIFLILCLCAFEFRPDKSNGERLILTRLTQSQLTDCNGASVTFELRPDQTAIINGRLRPLSEAISYVNEKMRNRAERVITFWAAPDTKMDEVENVMARLHRASDGLFIFFLTSNQRRQLADPHNLLGCISPVNFKSLVDAPFSD